MAKPLQVAGAYHSRLMQPAQEKLAVALAGVPMKSPSVPVIANVTAREVSDPAEIRRSLEAQVTGSVRWTESMQCLRAAGHEVFLELGPGGVLSGLMGRIDKAARVMAIEDLASLDKVAAELVG
jgi:[acyl-carrier-protein] S-malonyltransferase